MGTSAEDMYIESWQLKKPGMDSPICRHPMFTQTSLESVDIRSILPLVPISPSSSASSHAGDEATFNPAAIPSINPEACFDALPAELVADIVEKVAEDEDSRSMLYALSRVNRLLNAIAMPLLYARGVDSDMEERKRRAFTYTIGKKPHLAKLVKRIEASYLVWSGVKRHTVRKPKLADLRNRERAYDDLKLEDARRVEDKVDRTGRDLRLLDLALTAATNVEELVVADESKKASCQHMKQDFWWIELLVNAAKGTPVSPEMTCSTLKTLNICLDLHIRGWLRLETLSPVLRLQSLQDVTFEGFVEGDRIDNWGCPEHSSSVKKLRLPACFLHSDVVVQLLSACKSLSYFSYEYTTHNNILAWDIEGVGDPKCTFAEHSWKDVYDGLRRHKDSLQVLKLFYDVDAVWLLSAEQEGYDVDTKQLGSFEDFSKLKKLVLPAKDTQS